MIIWWFWNNLSKTTLYKSKSFCVFFTFVSLCSGWKRPLLWVHKIIDKKPTNITLKPISDHILLFVQNLQELISVKTENAVTAPPPRSWIHWAGLSHDTPTAYLFLQGFNLSTCWHAEKMHWEFNCERNDWTKSALFDKSPLWSEDHTWKHKLLHKKNPEPCAPGLMCSQREHSQMQNLMSPRTAHIYHLFLVLPEQLLKTSLQHAKLL